MRWTIAFLFVLSLMATALIPQTSAEPRGPQRQAGPGGGNEGGGPPGGYHLLPRFVVEKMDFTDEQMQQIKSLEAETRAKLEKILTPEQKKVLEESRPPRRGQGQGGEGNADRPREQQGANAQGQRGPRAQRSRD